MRLIFEPVTLDGNFGDEEGVLVYCEGRLAAVLSRLSRHHDEQAGRWYVEISFSPRLPLGPKTFETLAQLEESARVHSG